MASSLTSITQQQRARNTIVQEKAARRDCCCGIASFEDLIAIRALSSAFFYQFRNCNDDNVHVPTLSSKRSVFTTTITIVAFEPV